SADRADVLDPATQLLKHRSGASHVVQIATDKTKEFPVLGRSDRSTDRAVDKRRAPGADSRRKRLLDLGAYCAHFHKELAANLPAEQAARPVIRGVDRRRISQHGDD